MKNSEADQKKYRLNLFRKKLFYFLYGLGFVFLLGWGSSPYLKIGFNATDSVDGFLFLIVKTKMPKKGELAAFWPPKNDFYQDIWFVKYVKGISGDHVTRKGASFFINNEYIGDAKVKSKGGVILQPNQGGEIPEEHYFMWTSHKDSFDSRYDQINWIHQSRIIGRAYRIF